MEIFPDPLLVATFLPGFLIALLASWVILWKPLLAWIEEREAFSASARSRAAELETAIADRLAQVEQRLAVARAEITELRTAERAAASQAEAEIVAAARASAEQEIATATAEIVEQSEIARRGLAEASRSLAGDMASQVLGRPVQA